MNVQMRSGKAQLRITHKLLPKPYFCTFDTEADARSYGTQLESLLMRGIVPSELLAPAATGGEDPVVTRLISQYCELAPVTDSDAELLDVVTAEVAGLRVSGMTMKWAEGYVARLKGAKVNLAPGTIRKRVGVLSRVVDWHHRRNTPDNAVPPANALRLLPRGYSLYTKVEAEQLKAVGRVAKVDVKRDRRLLPEEEERVRLALAGEKRPGRERALKVDPGFVLLFDLIIDTGLRLSEAFRLRVDQIDTERRVIRVEGTKGHRGAIKPRVVPLKRVLSDKLAAWCKDRTGLLFGFWDGTAEGRDLASGRLTNRFATMFLFADVPNFTEHDLRHEATCRWFELRAAGGGWVFSDIEVCRIMGWTSTNMALRYASLRGEDLSARLLD